MSEYPSIPDRREPVICETFEDGLAKLEELSKLKKLQGIKCVIIGVCGLPGSGKSELSTQFLRKYNLTYSQTGKFASKIVGTESLEDPMKKSDFMKAQYLLIEGLAERVVLDERLKNTVGEVSDIYVSIRDMQSSYTGEYHYDKGADIIVHNQGSKGQQTPFGHVRG